VCDVVLVVCRFFMLLVGSQHAYAELVSRSRSRSLLQSVWELSKGLTQGCDPSTKGTDPFSLLCRQPGAVQDSLSTLWPSLPRGPQC